jgi:hypothetical protein
MAIGSDDDARVLSEEQLQIGRDEVGQVRREQEDTRRSRVDRLVQRALMSRTDLRP